MLARMRTTLTKSKTLYEQYPNILKYQREHEDELLALLGNEPDWSSFVSEGAIDTFKDVLLEGETYLCESQGNICGYIRALVDGFGIYVSELAQSFNCKLANKAVYATSACWWRY